jgi:hypothetical protein
MKKNEISQPLIMDCKCNFSHMILGTYNLVLSCQFQKKYNNQFSYPVIIRGNMKEKGSRFMLKIEDLDIYIFYEISDIIITDYYAFFKYHIYKTIPETFEYDHFVEMRYENEDEFTLFIGLLFQDKYITQEDLLRAMKQRKEIYTNIENSLRQFKLLKIASIHQTMDCKIELIWDIIRNMKMIHKYNHLLADQVEYSGNIISKDKIIKLINKNDDNCKVSFELIAKVKKCAIKKSKIGKEFNVEISVNKNTNTIPYYPIKKIIITVYEYEKKCSMYILFIFKDILNKDIFSIFNKEKNIELMRFKNIIENYSKKSGNSIKSIE